MQFLTNAASDPDKALIKCFLAERTTPFWVENTIIAQVVAQYFWMATGHSQRRLNKVSKNIFFLSTLLLLLRLH